MRLELGTFPVSDVGFGSRTRWGGGLLELNSDELLAPVLAEPGVLGAKLEIARPGESARIVNYYDIVQPRIKVEGRGVVYPGRFGRPMDTVGEGRTHQLGGMTVIACVEGAQTKGDWAGGLGRGWVPDWMHQDTNGDLVKPERRKAWGNHCFIDMSGPGAVLPYSSVVNVCLSVKVDEAVGPVYGAVIVQSTLLRLSDKLAQAVVGLQAPEVEVFDLTKKKPSLPGVVFICLLSSREGSLGPLSPVGTAVYGATRLSAPWALDPTEMVDGAVTGGGWPACTWNLTNNPILLELCRHHGKTLNFLAAIVGRPNWYSEEEMVRAANRAAQTAKLLGAQGAIITNDIRGLQFVASACTVKACELLGVKTVWLSEEEDNEDGSAPAFLHHPPEMEAVVSTGTGAAGPFPSVDRVIGGADDVAWYSEQPPVPGRYGAGYVRDDYGAGRQSCIDY